MSEQSTAMRRSTNTDPITASNSCTSSSCEGSFIYSSQEDEEFLFQRQQCLPLFLLQEKSTRFLKRYQHCFLSDFFFIRTEYICKQLLSSILLCNIIANSNRLQICKLFFFFFFSKSSLFYLLLSLLYSLMPIFLLPPVLCLSFLLFMEHGKWIPAHHELSRLHLSTQMQFRQRLLPA